MLPDIDHVLLSWRTDLSNTTVPTSRRSWIQVAKTGNFTSSRYGKFSITREDLSQMLRNFRTVTPLAPTQLAVDYDHLSMDPKKPGDGAAAGWFTDLQLRGDGDELWGEVEWTQPAASRIENKEYRFVSPSFVKNYVSKLSGKAIGATLLAAAITNHPFLEGMAALTLSESPTESVQAFAFADSESDMTEKDCKDGEQAMKAKGKKDDASKSDAEESSETAQEADSESEADEKKNVELKDVQEPPARHGAKHMSSNVINLKDAEGKDVAFTPESLREQLKSMNLSEVPEGSIVISAAEVSELKTSLSETKEQVKNLSTGMAEIARASQAARVTSEIDALITAGRITRPTRDWAVKAFTTGTIDLAAFEEWKASVPAAGVIKLNTVHGTGADADAAAEPTAADKIMTTARQLVKDKNIELRDAIIEASAIHASEAGEYLDGFRPTVN